MASGASGAQRATPFWWKEGMRLEPKHLVSAGVAALAAVGSAVAIVVLHKRYVGSTDDRLCTEASARYTAGNMTVCESLQRERLAACHESDLVDMYYVGLGAVILLSCMYIVRVASKTITICKAQRQEAARRVELASVQEESQALLDSPPD